MHQAGKRCLYFAHLSKIQHGLTGVCLNTVQTVRDPFRIRLTIKSFPQHLLDGRGGCFTMEDLPDDPTKKFSGFNNLLVVMGEGGLGPGGGYKRVQVIAITKGQWRNPGGSSQIIGIRSGIRWTLSSREIFKSCLGSSVKIAPVVFKKFLPTVGKVIEIKAGASGNGF